MDASQAEKAVGSLMNMNRTITIVFVIVVAMGVVASKLYMNDEARNSRSVEVSALTSRPVASENIVIVNIQTIGSEGVLIYEKKEGQWNLPQYGNAYAVADIVDGLIKDITDARGVIVDRNGKTEEWYGIGPGSYRVQLMDSAGSTQADVILGRTLPGMWDGDSYLKPAGDDVIYHVNSNPLPKLFSPDGMPSMIDRRVIPAARFSSLEICGMEELDVQGGEKKVMYEIGRRERELSEEELESLPPAMREMVFYQWFAVKNGAEILLDEKQTQSYAAFLMRMGYSGIVPAEKSPVGKTFPLQSMNIIFSGTREVDGEEKTIFEKHSLEIFNGETPGESIIALDGNPAVMKITADKGRYVFPRLDLLSAPVEGDPIYNSFQF